MIVFTGDINLTENAFDIGFGVGSRIAKGMNPFASIHKNSADIWVGNFEGVSSDVSFRTDYFKNTFRLPTSDLYKCSGLIDYYCIANNHVMEHGTEAFHQMCEALRRISSGFFGSKQFRSITFEHQSKTLSVTGFSLRNDQIGCQPEYWNFPELIEISNEYNVICSSDFKIAYIHWGVEYIDHPYFEQRSFAHQLIDIGYDLIVGMHPHVLQGYEVYKRKYIFYSLGNFVFDMAYEASKYGAVVKLDLESGSVGYDYVKIDDNFCPSIISEAQVPEQYRFTTLNKKVVNFDNMEVYVGEANRGLTRYRKANYKFMLKNIRKYKFSVLFAIVKNFIGRRL